MFLKKDSVVLGLILGFLAPFVGVGCFYLFKFSTSMTFQEFIQILLITKSFFTAIITVSLIADAGIFTLFINTNRDHTARGVFIATLIYAIICLILKYAY